MSGYRIATTLAAAWLCATPVAAQTIAEDEARIEELVRRELALRGKSPATMQDDATAVVGGASAPIEAPIGAEAPPTAVGEPAATRDESDAIADAEPPAEPTIFADMVPRDPGDIPIGDLASNAGRVVRVRSVGGRTHVGRIESVGPDTVTLRVRLGGGYATFALSFAQIATVTRL